MNIGSKSGQFKSDVRKQSKTPPKNQPSTEDSAADTPTVRQRISEARRTGILDLRELGLSGIPEDALKMTNLTCLLVGGNNISSVPSFITLPHLAYIDLSSNPKLNVIPNDIVNLQDLLILDIENTNLIRKFSTATYDKTKEKVCVFMDDFSNEDAADLSEYSNLALLIKDDGDEDVEKESEDEQEEEQEEELDYHHAQAQKEAKPFRHKEDYELGVAKEDITGPMAKVASDRFLRRLDALKNYQLGDNLRSRFLDNADELLIKYVNKRYAPNFTSSSVQVDLKSRGSRKFVVENNRKDKDKANYKHILKGRKEKSASLGAL